MGRSTVSVGLFIALFSLGAARPVQAESSFEKGWNDFWGIHNSPSGDAITSTYRPAKNGKKLDPTKLYLVEVNCHASLSSSAQITQGLVVKESTFVAHTLWLSNTAGSADGSVPSNPAKLINVFSFDKSASGQVINYSNGACSERFLISGSTSILTTSFSVVDTKSLSPMGQTLYSTAKAVTGIVPLFFGGALLSSITAGSSAFGSTQQSVQDIVSAFNSAPKSP